MGKNVCIKLFHSHIINQLASWVIKNLPKVKKQQGKDDNNQEQKKDDCMNFYNPTGKDQLGLDKLDFLL